MKREAKSIPTGKLARGSQAGLAVAKAGIKSAVHYGGQGFRNDGSKKRSEQRFQKEIGSMAFKMLSQLRGTALKVSQMLSMESTILPETIRKELAKACHQVIPLNRALIHKVFVAEFGQQPGQVFKEFESNSFAAASLGQVHNAYAECGDPLAVKIQYPGIAASIDSDMSLIRRFVWSISKTTGMLPAKEALDIAMDEIDLRLREEMNYEVELKNTLWFQDNLTSPGIKIPEVRQEFCTKRIFTTKKLEGKQLKAWLRSKPDQKERDRFGQILFDSFVTSVFELNCVHADPHPGNYIFMEDGRLGIIDFGCIKHIHPDFILQIQRIFKALLGTSIDHTEIYNSYVQLGLFASDQSMEQFENEVFPALQPFFDWAIAPFRVDTFNFKDLPPIPMEISDMRQMKVIKGMHRDQIYFDRTYSGIFNLLKEMGARVNTKNNPFKANI